jgi:hypothetical protein
MTLAKVSASEFAAALKVIPVPGAARLRFLLAHYQAPGRALTMRKMAKKAGYKDYRGVNLWYGKLAKDVGLALGQTKERLGLLVEFAPPKSVTNKEWVIIMRPEFAQALKRVDWI